MQIITFKKKQKNNTDIIQTEQWWHLQCGVLAQALVDLRAPSTVRVDHEG